jgi:antitoxin ParD1/3/4
MRPPSEFVRDLLRHRKLQMDAEKLREGVLEGFQDAIAGRVQKFDGSVRDLLKQKRI